MTWRIEIYSTIAALFGPFHPIATRSSAHFRRHPGPSAVSSPSAVPGLPIMCVSTARNTPRRGTAQPFRASDDRLWKVSAAEQRMMSQYLPNHELRILVLVTGLAAEWLLCALALVRPCSRLAGRRCSSLESTPPASNAPVRDS